MSLKETQCKKKVLILWQISNNAHPHTENVGEPAGRSVRANRGQGGHAYQLENALIPRYHKDKVHKKNQGIPENVPKNPMAPPAGVIGTSYSFKFSC